MKGLLKKSSADTGVGSMLLSLVTLIIMLVLMLFSFGEVEISLIAVTFRDGMDIVCLSSVVPDVDAMRESAKDAVGFDPDNGFGIGVGPDGDDGLYFIIEEDRSYERFLDIFNTNVVDTVEVLDVSDIVVEEVILYTVYGEDVNEYSFDSSGNCVEKVYPDAYGKMYAPNYVPTGREEDDDDHAIKYTSVYARISFTYTDAFGIEHTGLSVDNFKSIRFK